jgi:pyruvate formate lyase activating enzyme
MATPTSFGAPLASLVRSGELGFVHSEQTGSALDGPGLRTVFWLSGCVLRCQYCHNPDTWKLKAGRAVRPLELVSEALKYRAFMRRSGGGLTLSGGEPLVQHAFVARVCAEAHAQGLHTALDTNGYFGHLLSNRDLSNVDLVLLDLKSMDRARHRRLTRVEPEPIFAFAERLAALGRPVWVRFVLVPGVTDEPQELATLARYCRDLGNVERLDVLPFHQLGKERWGRLGIEYPLAATVPPDAAAVAAARAVFRAHGVRCPAAA